MTTKFLDRKYTQKELCDFLNSIESEINITDWHRHDINMWIPVRCGFSKCIEQNWRKPDTENAQFNSPGEKYKFKFLSRFSNLGSHILHGIYGLFQIILIVMGNLKSIKSSAHLLIGDGVSKCKLANNTYIDKYLDPIRMKDGENRSTIFIDVNYFRGKTFSKVFFINYLDDLTYVIARFIILFSKNKSFKEPIDQFKKLILSYKLTFKDLSDTTILIKYYQIKMMSLYFKFILWLFSIEKVYVVSYYHIFGYALAYACHKMDIPLIEVQHGSQEYHLSYQSWKNDKGKNWLLPTQFWHWNETTHINFQKRNSEEFLKHHTSFIGGLPWKLLPDHFGLTGGLVKNKELFSGHILITMQPDFYAKDVWLKLIPIIIKNTHCCWWIRKHPSYMDEPHVMDILNSPKYNHIKFKDANDLPIYTLFGFCNLHITMESSSAIEADIYGIKTLFLSTNGKYAFPELFAKGSGLYCNPETELDSYLNTCFAQEIAN